MHSAVGFHYEQAAPSRRLGTAKMIRLFASSMSTAFSDCFYKYCSKLLNFSTDSSPMTNISLVVEECQSHILILMLPLLDLQQRLSAIIIQALLSKGTLIALQYF